MVMANDLSAPVDTHSPERRQPRVLAREFYEATPALLHTVDPTGKIVTVSNHWLSRLGYMRDHVVGRNFNEFLTPQSKAYADSIGLPRFLRRGHSREVEYQMVSSYGEIIDVLLSASALYDDEGGIEQALVVLTDVSERKRIALALASSEVAYRELFINMQAGFALLEVVYDDNGQAHDMRFVAANHAYAMVRQLTAHEPLEDRLIGALYRSVGQDIEWLPSNIAVALSGQGFRAVRYLAKTHQWHDVVCYQTQPGRCALIVQDITEQHRAQITLAEQHERLQITFQSIGDGLITTDAAGIVDYLNPIAEHLTGWALTAAVGRPVAEVFRIIDEITGETVSNPVDRCLAEQRVVSMAHKTALIDRNGKPHSIEDSAAPIKAKNGSLLGVVLVFHDVTEQRRLSAEMTHRASHDPLTGCLNRTAFEQRLQTALSSAQDSHAIHAVLYLDLDRFKLVNDACGHTAGDQLLMQVVGILQSSIRGRDTLARLGGDEFGVILDFCGLDQALRIAQLICDRIDAYRYIHDGRRFHIGASVGLVLLDDRWQSIATLLQAADMACYAAKHAGRNRVHVADDTDTTIAAHHSHVQWASRLEHALEDNGFCLYWQKITLGAASQGDSPAISNDLFDGPHPTLHGEILLRMWGPTGDIIEPKVFLPAAERFHMASRADRWVIKTVFNWMIAHAAHIAHIDTIAINLSGQSIGDLAFHRFLLGLLDTLPVDRHKLCLEITETSAISNLTDAHTFLEAVRARGVRCALDDFGSGMSSFGYLKRLPVDYLKIDGQFIQNLASDEIDQATVRCICEVAKVMGKKTIAEFVETEDTEILLRQIGVDFTQGYLRHRPEPLDLMLTARNHG